MRQEVVHQGVVSVPAGAVAPWRRGLGVAAFAAVLALSAQVRVPLPFTPVPVTLQTAVVLLSGALLGTSGAALSVVAYLALGAAGLPVFSGAAGGLAPFSGPTAGYLFGFAAAAALVGALRPVGRRAWALVLVLAAGEALVHLFGVVGLAAITGVGLKAAFVQGSLPFWPAAAAKIGFVAAVIRLYGAPLARLFGNAKDVDSKRTSVCA
jgi:biotin transport system substrate-specific component